MRPTELVLAEVVQTFKRMVVDEVIDLRVEHADGDTATITGTHEHPFYVPAVDHYVKLGELEPGDVLRTDASGEAVVVDLTRHAGEFEVFNIEVDNTHNYFVRGPGFDGPGVLVHNKDPSDVRMRADADDLPGLDGTGKVQGSFPHPGGSVVCLTTTSSNFAMILSRVSKSVFERQSNWEGILVMDSDRLPSKTLRIKQIEKVLEGRGVR